jgi:hypothetical protein
MNIRFLTLVASAVASLGLVGAACGNSSGSGAGGGAAGGTANGGGGAAPCAMSCAAAITDGDLPCTGDPSGADTDYMALKSCAEMNCATECGSQFDDGMGIDSACGGCYATPCSAEATACANN